MLNNLVGWYCRETLGCRFASIRFEETIPANTEQSLLISDSLDGVKQAAKLHGYNFIVLDMYSYTTPGIVTCRISPDNDTQKSFYIDAYEPARTSFVPPKLVSVDMAVKYTNNQSQSSNVFLSFNGFWIPEDKMADFSLIAEIIAESAYTLGKLGEGIISKLDETNSLLRSIASAQGVDVSNAGGGGTAHSPLSEQPSVCRRRR